jgi:hypothetical protein
MLEETAYIPKFSFLVIDMGEARIFRCFDC